MPPLEEAEAVILEAIATLRALGLEREHVRLLQQRPEDVRLQRDVVRVVLRQRAAERLEVLEEAERVHRKLAADPESKAMLAYLRAGQAETLGALGRGTTVAAMARRNEELSALRLEVAGVSRQLAEERDLHRHVADELRSELVRVGDDRDRARQELVLMTQTISWRLTGPLRSIRRWLPAR